MAHGAPDEAFAALEQYPDAHLVATPVSNRVNAPKNNDLSLLSALQPDCQLFAPSLTSGTAGLEQRIGH
ncbi:MAG: hypothetical protein ACLPV8_13400 [Steroidobacteraceae bacterium]